ncbi:hypothetical protein PTI98_005036 [Pleurotus ostreatus]|nr:hypothetical protein PTI98_005036 [Pleurotus ostreatus]
MSLPPTVRFPERLLNVWKWVVLQLKQWTRQCERAHLGRLLGMVLNAFRRLSELRVSGYEATRSAKGIDAPSQPANSLVVLPTELLTLVLAELELRDLRRARCSCRSLYTASKSRAIWLRLFWQLSDPYVLPIIPPRPLETYGAAELESMVLQWTRVDHGWSSCSIRQQPPPQRILDHDWPNTPFALIEGGRWLLTTDKCGSVLVHDLDSPSLATGTHVLIRPEDKRDHVYISKMSVCIDRSSPTLEFNLALSHDYGRLSTSSRVSIWRVRLVDTTGHRPKLSSKLLNSFYTRVSKVVFDASLLRSLYARIVSPWAVELFNWEDSKSMVHVKSHIHPVPDMASVRLLPGRRVLTGRGSSIHIYAIPECTYHSATLPFDPLENTDAQTPLQVIPIGGPLVIGGISPSYSSYSGTIYISLATAQHIFALITDAEDNETAVIKLIDYSMRFDGTVYALSLHRTLIRQDYMPTSVITLNLLRDEQFDVHEHYWHDNVHRFSITTLDEWSGRVVDHLKDGRIVVIDFLR